MGFSAGAHLAACASSFYTLNLHEPIDDIDLLSAKPNFTILGYPPFTTPEQLSAEREHIAASKNEDLQYREDILLRYQPEKHINENTPSAFIMETDDDPTTFAENAITYYMACRKAKVPAELHIFQTGGHGYGLGDHLLQVGMWKDLLLKWLTAMKILS